MSVWSGVRVSKVGKTRHPTSSDKLVLDKSRNVSPQGTTSRLKVLSPLTSTPSSDMPSWEDRKRGMPIRLERRLLADPALMELLR